MKTEGRQQVLLLWRNYLPIIIVCVVGVLISYFMALTAILSEFSCSSSSGLLPPPRFNIISGYGGQVVFGYMMFVGTGAYTTVLLFKFLGVSPWFGMWVGVIIAVIIAFIIGLPTLRLHGAFFAIATVAFPLIPFPILNHLGLEEVSIPFTGHGASSMQFTDMRFYVLIAVALLAVVLIMVQTIESSRFGFALRALKQNETAAEGMGINTYWTKIDGFHAQRWSGCSHGGCVSFRRPIRFDHACRLWTFHHCQNS